MADLNELLNDMSPEGLGYSEPAVDLEKMAQDALARFKEDEAYWSPVFAEMADDYRYTYTRDHWDDKEKLRRKGRPTLVVPLIRKFVKRVVGESKKNPPSIRLSPRGGEDKVKADVLNGTIRYIEDRCGAQYAYTNALDQAAVSGFGAWRVNYRTEDGRGIIAVEPVMDALSVYFDCASRAMDGSDARHVTVVGESRRGGKKLRTYEHYWVEDDGRVLWCVIEGTEVVSHGEWPLAGHGVPIVPVFYEVVEYGGERVVQGIARQLIDAQKAYNYLESQRVEIIALTPKSPIMAAEGSLVDEDAWQRSAEEPVPVLYYKPVSDDMNNPNPIPSRMVTTPDVGWLSQTMADVKQHFHDASGIYDSNLGNDPRQLSGRAIVAKQEAGDYSQVGATEHLVQSVKRTGEIVMHMIPIVMGNEQALNILGEDGVMKSIPTSGVDKDGKPYRLDLEPRDIDLSVSSAPAYATRRQEFVDRSTSLLTAMPAAANLIGDLVVRNMDFPGAEEAADRLFKALPPELKEKQGWVPQEIADQMQQKTQQAIQQLQQQLAQANGRAAQLEHQLRQDREMEMARERLRSETTLTKTAMELQGDAQLSAMELQAQQERDNAKIAADLLKEQAKNPPPVVVGPPPAPMPMPSEHGGGSTNLTYRPSFGADGRPINPLA